VSPPEATSIRSVPDTTPIPSVVLTSERALSLIGPVKSASPVALPVYTPSVATSVLPSVVVHDRVLNCDGVPVENPPATDFALFVPSRPSATAIPAATSATSAAAAKMNLRFMRSSRSDVC
jgi:hypothetical protein